MSGGSSKNENQSQDTSTQQIDRTQMNFLRNLWQHSNRFVNSGQGDANTEMGGQFVNQFANNPYGANFQQFMQPNNPMAQQQIDILGQNLNQQFNNQVMPRIDSNAIMSGQFGGGRQGVAQGLAMQGLQQSFGQGAQGILNNSYNQALNATNMGGQFNNQSAAMGIQGLGSLQQQQFMPYMSLAQILGNPTVLGSGFGTSVGSGSEMHGGMGIS